MDSEVLDLICKYLPQLRIERSRNDPAFKMILSQPLKSMPQYQALISALKGCAFGPFCTKCGSSFTRFRYFDNSSSGKVVQPRYRCQHCNDLFTFGGRRYSKRNKVKQPLQSFLTDGKVSVIKPGCNYPMSLGIDPPEILPRGMSIEALRDDSTVEQKAHPIIEHVEGSQCSANSYVTKVDPQKHKSFSKDEKNSAQGIQATSAVGEGKNGKLMDCHGDHTRLVYDNIFQENYTMVENPHLGKPGSNFLLLLPTNVMDKSFVMQKDFFGESCNKNQNWYADNNNAVENKSYGYCNYETMEKPEKKLLHVSQNGNSTKATQEEVPTENGVPPLKFYDFFGMAENSR